MSLSQHIRHLPAAMCGRRSVRRDLLRKQKGTDPMSTWCCPFLQMPSFSHDAFSATPITCWTSVHFYGTFFWGESRKMASLLLPESPTGSPCRGALSGRCSDRFQMLPACGGGQQSSVEAPLQLWLIGVRMKLGVMFPALVFSLTASPCPICPFCCHVSWRAQLRRRGAQRGTLHVWLFASSLLSI